MVSIVYPAVAMAQQRGLKRDSSHLSSPSSSDSLASQTKRLKVAFDDKIDVKILDDWAGAAKPQELVREEVRLAIEGHLRPGSSKDDTAYDQLRTFLLGAAVDRVQGTGGYHHDSFQEEGPSAALLKQYFVALLGRVNDLKGCGTLIHAALDINWFGRDEAFVGLYVRFLGALASAIPGFLEPVMDRIVRHFSYLPASLGRVGGQPVAPPHQMLARLHNTLRYLIRLIPSAVGSLSEVLTGAYPNHRTTRQRHYLAFIRNLFRVTEYAPELKSDVLTLITERLVKIDVEIQEEIDDLEDDAEEDIVMGAQRVKDEEDQSDESDTESDAESDLDNAPDERKLRILRQAVTKLDAVLDMLFDYYTTAFTEANRFESEDTFDQLLSLFVTFVLPTYRSRHSQFLVFHFSQISQRNTAKFVSQCMKLATGQSTASNGSVFAAAYLASFIARGAKVPKYIVRDVVTLLGTQIIKFQRSYEPTCRGPDLSRYALFYTCVQALLYIFCFRWRDLIVMSEYDTEADLEDYDVFASGEPKWIPGLKEIFTQAIYSKLNPMKVCSPTIVNQFAAIANHLRFMFVYPILETNKRIKLSSYRSYGGTFSSVMGVTKRESALSAKSGEAHFQLDAFFPFDPYQLPKSKRWLQTDYNEWKGVPGMKIDDDEDASDNEDDDDDDSESDEDEVDGSAEDIDSDSS